MNPSQEFWDPNSSKQEVRFCSASSLKSSAVLGFYDTAWVTPAIIDVWSTFGENVLGAVSGVNTEQLPHKNCFPPGVQRSVSKYCGLACSTNCARVNLRSWQVNSETDTQTPSPEKSQGCANPTNWPSDKTDLGSLLRASDKMDLGSLLRPSAATVKLLGWVD